MTNVGFTVCSQLKFLKHVCYLKAMFMLFNSWGFNTCRCCVEDNCNIKRKGMSRGLWDRILVLRDHEKLSMYILVLGETPKTNTHTWACMHIHTYIWICKDICGWIWMHKHIIYTDMNIYTHRGIDRNSKKMQLMSELQWDAKNMQMTQQSREDESLKQK